MTTSRIHWAALTAVLLLAAVVYWPGLSGGYFFDDIPNFVDNPDVHVSTLDWTDWRRAALASPSPDLRRPLAMLSFAANYYFTQLNPFPIKLTNLLVHLLNGLLLWRVVLTLLTMWRDRSPHAASESTVRWTALVLTSAWLLAPINLTAILYAVQRMESMAHTFVLAGLLLYLSGRRRMLTGKGGFALATLGLMLGSGLGVLCKESAVLLPVYAFLVELTILRFDAATPTCRRRLWIMYAALLLIPAVVGLAWLLPRTLADASYARRPFTLAQRLLTESRILIDYVGWTLLPLPGALSFYHDDIALSRSWLSPPSTLICTLMIGASVTAAVVLVRRLPLVTLGIAWYYAAHALTATIIPLELVFEHRNYFASIGLLLAVAGLLLSLPPDLTLLRRAIPALGLAVFAAVTALRAHEWSHPVTLALAEAGHHPLSPRANYELGRTLIIASAYKPDSPLIEPAIAAFERAAKLPNSGASAYASLIVVAGHLHREPHAEWWSGLAEKLAARPPSTESVAALASLADCQRKRECPPDPGRMLDAFLAALSHPSPSGRLLAAYGAFAANALGDYDLADRMLSKASRIEPESTGIRIDLVSVLLLKEQYTRAAQVLGSVRRVALSGTQAEQYDSLLKVIRTHQAMPGDAELDP